MEPKFAVPVEIQEVDALSLRIRLWKFPTDGIPCGILSVCRILQAALERRPGFC